MIDISDNTLAMAIQAVKAQIRYYDNLLTSETVRGENEADIQEIIFSYEKALLDLKREYLKIYDKDSNMTPYENLVK